MCFFLILSDVFSSFLPLAERRTDVTLLQYLPNLYTDTWATKDSGNKDIFNLVYSIYIH